MRVSLIVSALFATSLIGGVALADRPGDGEGRTSMPRVHEMRVREVREVREVRTRDDIRVVREAPVREVLRERGDMVDRSSARATVTSKGQADALSQVSRVAKDKQPNAKEAAVRNCAPTDDSCASSARSQARSTEQKAREKAAAEKAAADQAKRDRDEVQRMREKVRADRLKAIIQKMVCEKHASTCADNL